MPRKQHPPEFEVQGSKDLGFTSHPEASIQYVVGAFLPPHAGSQQQSVFASLVSECETPVGLWTHLAASLERFSLTLDVWRKLLGQFAALDSTDVSDLPASMQSATADLEFGCQEVAFLLGVTHRRLLDSIDSLPNDPHSPILLGLPIAVSEELVTPQAKRLTDTLKKFAPQIVNCDLDSPFNFAKADFITSEMVESMRELGRDARYLWTNPPEARRVRRLLEWMFDFRCECLELTPVLACLRPPVNAWRSATQP